MARVEAYFYRSVLIYIYVCVCVLFVPTQRTNIRCVCAKGEMILDCDKCDISMFNVVTSSSDINVIRIMRESIGISECVNRFLVVLFFYSSHLNWILL